MQNIIAKCVLIGTLIFSSTAQGAKVYLEKSGQVSFGDAFHYKIIAQPQMGHVIHKTGVTNIVHNSTDEAPYIFAKIVWEGNETVTFFDRFDGKFGNDAWTVSGQKGDNDMFTCGSSIMHAKSVRIESA